MPDLPLPKINASFAEGAIIFVIVLLVNGVKLYQATKAKRAPSQSWRQLTQAQGWEYVESDEDIIIASIGAIRVLAYPSSSAEAKIFAKLPIDSSFFISLKQKTTLPSTNNVVLGDPSFDREYSVQSNHETLCRLWLNAANRRLITDAAPYQFELKSSEITLRYSNKEENAARFFTLINTAATLAAHSRHLSQRWRRFANELGAEPTSQHQLPLTEISALALELRGVTFLIQPSSTPTGELITLITTQAHHPTLNQTLQEQNAPILSCDSSEEGTRLTMSGFGPPASEVLLVLSSCADILTKEQSPYR